MGDLRFSKLSLHQKLQKVLLSLIFCQKRRKVLLSLIFIITLSFGFVEHQDYNFNSDTTKGIRYLCVWNGINLFDWVFALVMATTILVSNYYFAKQIESIKAKIICTAIFIFSELIEKVVLHNILIHCPISFSQKVPVVILYFGVFALIMLFLILFEYKILPQKFGRKKNLES